MQRMVKGVSTCSDVVRKKDVTVCPTVVPHDTMILPTTTTVPDGRHVTISKATDRQISELYVLVQEAARHGDGFGADEFPTEAHFRSEMQDAKMLFVCEKDSGKTLAVLVIALSKFFRGQCVADPYIIVQADERRKGIGEFCFHTCVDYCKRLGFLGIYIDTFSNNLAMRRIVENTPGFRRVGILPMGGCLPDGSIVSSIVYHKDLRVPECQGQQEMNGDLDLNPDPPS